MNEVFNPSDGLIRDDDVKTNIFIYATHTPKTPQFFGEISAVRECYGNILTPLKAPIPCRDPDTKCKNPVVPLLSSSPS